MVFIVKWGDIPDNVKEKLCYECGSVDLSVTAVKYVENVEAEFNKYGGSGRIYRTIYFNDEACYTWFLLRWSQ
jgi:hypothetical protein